MQQELDQAVAENVDPLLSANRSPLSTTSSAATPPQRASADEVVSFFGQLETVPEEDREEAEESRADLERRINAYKKANAAAQETNRTLQTRLKDLRASATAQLDDATRAFSTQHKDLERKHRDLTKRFDDLKKRKEKDSEALRLLSERVAATGEAYSATAGSEASIQEMIAGIEENRVLRKKIDDMAVDYNALIEVNAELRDERDDAETKILDLNRQLREEATPVEAGECQRCRQLEGELHHANRNVKGYQADLAKANNMLDQRNAEYALLSKSEALYLQQLEEERRQHSTTKAQLDQARKARGLSKKEMAERMNTSRAQLDRILDANDASLTLETLSRASRVVGCRVSVELAAT